MQEKEIKLTDYVDFIFRYKWTILLTTLAVFIIIIIFTLTRPSVYKSSCTFMIEMTDVSTNKFDQLSLSSKVRPMGFYQAVIKSRKFRENVAQKLEINDSTTINFIEAISLVINNLSLQSSVISGMYELGANTNDPIISYLLANIGTDMFKQRCQGIDQEDAQNIVNFVDKQRIVAKNKLEQTERELQKFKEKSNISFTEDGGLVKKLVKIENQLTEVQTQKELARANLDALNLRLKDRRGEASTNLNNPESPEVIQWRDAVTSLENQRNELLQVSGEKNPQFEQLENKILIKKRELVEKMIDSASGIEPTSVGETSFLKGLEQRRINEELNLYIMENREKFFDQLMVNFKKQHPDLLEHTMEISRLSRAKTVSENLFNFLLEKGEEAKIKAATGTGGIKIIDPAIFPTNPIPRKTTRNATLSIILGLALGFGIALIREFMDNTIRSEEDITNFLGLPIMGMVPEIVNNNGNKISDNPNRSKTFSSKQINNSGNDSDRRTKLISHMNLRDPITETYRSMRTNLEFSWLDKPVQCMMLTSPTPGDGKSITLANLGISFAEIGRRTLIVDTDLRKPVQHKIFGTEKKPGLTDYLVGDVSLEQVVYDVGVENLKVIPVGKNPPNPAEILSSKKFQEFIESQKEKFDMILFDTPPVISVTDPVLMSRKVDGVLFVVKFAKTDRQVAASAIESLKKSRANILGAVLNSTQFHRGYGYYRYYSYYNYYYSDSGKGKMKKNR
jgi:capsular exopolysaccharide synthesis family protein